MLLVMMASHRVRALAAMQMDFVASISHELRTPLTAMLAAGQNISDGFAPDLPKYGSSITTQARHLIDLVDQILLFAAMRDGKQKYVLEPISVEAILRKLQKTTFPVLEEAGFMLGIEIADRLPLALGDSQAIFRCIQNLLENAAKYSGNSRWIAIRVNLNESLKFGRELSISVADHGMGIEPAELERIFDPFYRGASVVAAQIRGSGLGLSVVKHIVTALGGRLDVTSKPGQGSVFTLYLRTAEHSNDLCERKMEAVVLR
jgi:signal transduction histidine kinase